jgi:hypothetical protein
MYIAILPEYTDRLWRNFAEDVLECPNIPGYNAIVQICQWADAISGTGVQASVLVHSYSTEGRPIRPVSVPKKGCRGLFPDILFVKFAETDTKGFTKHIGGGDAAVTTGLNVLNGPARNAAALCKGLDTQPSVSSQLL